MREGIKYIVNNLENLSKRSSGNIHDQFKFFFTYGIYNDIMEFIEDQRVIFLITVIFVILQKIITQTFQQEDIIIRYYPQTHVQRYHENLLLKQ